MTSLALSFQETQFDVIDRNNQPWLRSNQIGLALEYKNPELSINKLYRANSDEFSDAMTALVELETKGGKQKVRIFSLRGAHLLAMFARTKIAKEFRKWVLDILDRETQQMQQQLVTPEQAGELATLIKERFPDGIDRAYAWSRFNKHFRIARYRELPQEKFTEACRYIPAMPDRDEIPEKNLPAVRLPAIKPPVWTRPDPAGTKDAVRNLQTTKQIIRDLQIWANDMPEEIGHPLWDALDDINKLMITCWTEIDEALMHMSISQRFLKRWLGKGR